MKRKDILPKQSRSWTQQKKRASTCRNYAKGTPNCTRESWPIDDPSFPLTLFPVAALVLRRMASDANKSRVETFMRFAQETLNQYGEVHNRAPRWHELNVNRDLAPDLEARVMMLVHALGDAVRDYLSWQASRDLDDQTRKG